MEGLRVDDLVVQSHRGRYTVRFGRLFEGLEAGLTERQHMIIDARVARLYAHALRVALRGPSVLSLEATEANKSLEAFPKYVTQLLDRGIRRNHELIAVGGGIIQDV